MRDQGQVDRLDADEQAIVDAMRAPVAVDARSFDSRVMAAVRNETAHGSRVVRMHRGRVAGAVTACAAGAAIVAAIAIVVHRPRGEHPAGTLPVRSAAAIAPVQRAVTFTLVAAGASRVAVAGSFNGWSIAATPLRKVGKDTWTAEIPLSAGRYVYQFVVDGTRWVADPRAPHDAADDFGASNSVVTVASSGSA
ncbi:MAG: isoamylase early set domain-containing protein [Gemmatimonadales bacterium]